jgi:hypothetical protein
MEKKGQAMGSAVVAVAASAIVGIIALVVYAGVLNANKVAINSASVLWLVLSYVPVFIGLGLLLYAIYSFMK